MAATKIQSINLENALITYSLTGGLVYDVDNEDDKPWLYSMFVAYSCDGCTAATLNKYPNNENFQELPKERNYFTNTDKNCTLT